MDAVSPVAVFDIDGRLLLVDGHHRVAAGRSLVRSSVKADVRAGTRANTLRFAVALAMRQRGISEEEAMAAIGRRAATEG